ncbi:MAG: hypothetical protein E7012_02270 [Alphaproteobacteria bacterium]|nr:hypothetical protein [Alphaproteobacteria bacterium]
MIKGLVSLFTSGLIFNPMILLGIGLGVFSVVNFDLAQIRLILSDYRCYLSVFVIAVMYVLMFKKSYKDDAVTLDYPLMLGRMMTETMKCLLAYVLSMIFVVLIGF